MTNPIPKKCDPTDGEIPPKGYNPTFIQKLKIIGDNGAFDDKIDTYVRFGFYTNDKGFTEDANINVVDSSTVVTSNYVEVDVYITDATDFKPPAHPNRYVRVTQDVDGISAKPIFTVYKITAGDPPPNSQSKQEKKSPPK